MGQNSGRSCQRQQCQRSHPAQSSCLFPAGNFQISWITTHTILSLKANGQCCLEMVGVVVITCLESAGFRKAGLDLKMKRYGFFAHLSAASPT